MKTVQQYAKKFVDVHLMIAPVDPFIQAYADAGADLISAHVEAGPHIHRTLQAIRATGKMSGVALNPGTPAEAVEHLLDLADLVCVMTVNPGFGGQKFIPGTLDKLREARALIDASGREIRLEIDGGVNVQNIREIAEAGADTFAGQIPTILKCNSANSLMSDTAGKNQAVTATVQDALRLGCSAIGFTIYPGSDMALDMFEEISEMRAEAASVGIPTVIWSYPRGEAITKDGETAIDIAAYAAQIAALLGAHIIKIKLSTDHLEQGEAKKAYEKAQIDVSTQTARVRHCMNAAFAGRRIVVFSGGAAKDADAVYDDARAIRDGGGNGSIIGRNTFQRERTDALAMLNKLVEIYKGRD